jgi:hypothetical protein
VSRPARLPKQQKQRVIRLKRRYPTKRKAEGETAEAPLPKHEKTEAPLPKHGKRLFIKAIFHWVNEYGKSRQCEGTFLVDSGCTGAIMNSEVVFQHKLP